MVRPKLYESDGVLSDFIHKTSEKDLVRYIRTINKYIFDLENAVGIDDEIAESNKEDDLDY